MASLKFRWTDVVWRTVGNGKLKLQWGGAWISPSFVKVKSGATGGGVWVDSGYLGYPADPTSFGVYSWPTHDAVQFKWAAGAGGAPPSDYEVAINNTSGGRVATSYDAGSPSINFTQVAQNTTYYCYVRARTAAGLVSNWVGMTIKMGKDDASYYTTESSTRPWSLAASVNGYKDANVGPAVATNRVVQTVRYQISANGGFTSVLSPYNNREIYRVQNSSIQERFSWGQSVDTTVNVADYWGSGAITGMRCTGAGWATGPATHVARAVGTITASGYETYSYQQYHSVPAIANQVL